MPGPGQPEAENNQHHTNSKADSIDITYYTDPLCCWSWAFEPQWRKMVFEYGAKINFRYRMGGLLPGWKNFHDPVNFVSRPVQMGPVWMHAAQLSGMPIQHDIWIKDPPASSYPACIAVKCAELQSAGLGDRYLRLIREEVMINGNNVAREVVLMKIARELKIQISSFNIKTFEQDLHNDRGLDAFKEDLQEVRYHEINRFPTLIIRKAQQPSILITGHRPYAVLTEALNKIYPGITKDRVAQTVEEYTRFWSHVLPREIDEITNKG